MYDYGYFVELYPKDVQRLSPYYQRKHVIRGSLFSALVFGEEDAKLATKTGSDGIITCVAFRGRVGGPCRCSIYEMRPTACRAFNPGSRYCREARKLFGVS